MTCKEITSAQKFKDLVQKTPVLVTLFYFGSTEDAEKPVKEVPPDLFGLSVCACKVNLSKVRQLLSELNIDGFDLPLFSCYFNGEIGFEIPALDANRNPLTPDHIKGNIQLWLHNHDAFPE